MLCTSTDEKRLELIRKCIPPLPTVTGETGPLQADYAAFTWTKLHSFQVLNEKPFEAEHMSDDDARAIAGRWPTVNDDHPYSSLWSLHLDTDVGRWAVLGRFATLPLGASKLPVERLSLDPEKNYLAFDFWKEEYLGVVRGSLDCPELELGHCQIISLREALARPQFLSSTRHVSQDAISLKSQSWDTGKLTLGLEGVSGTTETYWVYAPKGFEVSAIEGIGLDAQLAGKTPDASGGHAVAIHVTFPAANSDRTTGTLVVRFR